MHLLSFNRAQKVCKSFVSSKAKTWTFFCSTTCSDASFPKLAVRKHPSLAVCVFFCSTTTGHWKYRVAEVCFVFGSSSTCISILLQVTGDASNMGYTCKSTLSRTTCYLIVFYTLMGLLYLPQGWNSFSSLNSDVRGRGWSPPNKSHPAHGLMHMHSCGHMSWIFILQSSLQRGRKETHDLMPQVTHIAFGTSMQHEHKPLFKCDSDVTANVQRTKQGQ